MINFPNLIQHWIYTTMPQHIPIFDLHCDLLAYLALVPHASIEKTEDIGVALPFLAQGNVAAQVLAIFSPTENGSTNKAKLQVETFQTLTESPHFYQPPSLGNFSTEGAGKIAIIPAIENASGFCEEDEPLKQGIQRLEYILSQLDEVMYISLTHHDENRFGGGNYSDNTGLKPDGESLLDYLDRKNTAIDLSHASDQLAYDILSYTTKNNLEIPIMASHSNFRSVCGHVRNLPLELVQEIILRSGLIGINLLRAYVDDHHPQKLTEHISYGFSVGGAEHMGFGADFFYIHDFHDPSRYPLYHPEHQNASVYPQLLEMWSRKGIITDDKKQKDIAFQNVANFLSRNWE